MPGNRSLGPTAATIHYVSSILGTGLVIAPALSVHVGGPYALFTWILLAILSVPFSLVFIWLALVFGNARGIPLFVEEAFGRAAGTFTGIFQTTVMFIGNPIMGITFARYFASIIHLPNSVVLPLGYAVTLLSLATNCLKTRAFAFIQQAALVVFLFLFLSTATLSLHSHLSALSFGSGSGKPILSNLTSTFLICFLAFTGWENGITIVEELRRPGRDLLIGTCVASFALLIVYGLTVLCIIQYYNIYGDALNPTTILTRIFVDQVGKEGGVYFSALVLLLLFASSNTWIFGTSRTIHALARDGVFPPYFGKLSQNGLPLRVLSAMALAYLIVVTTLVVARKSEITLVYAYSSGSLILFLAAFAAAARILPVTKRLIAISMATVVLLVLALVRSSLTPLLIMLVSSILLTIVLRRATRMFSNVEA